MHNDSQNSDVTRRRFLRRSSEIVAGAAVLGSSAQSAAGEKTAATKAPTGAKTAPGSAKGDQKMYKLRIVFDATDSYRFDRDYYVKKHLELAKKLLVGRVNLTRLEAQWNVKDLNRADVADLTGSAGAIAPLILSLYLETDDALKDFLAFLDSPGALSLDQDVANFTDLAPKWTIAEVEEFVWSSDG